MKKFLISLLFFPFISFAFIPFGGPILEVRSCCNGVMLKIRKYYRFWPGLPPTLYETGTYMFENGFSRLIVGSLDSGKWSLGLANRGGTCTFDTEIEVTTTTSFDSEYAILNPVITTTTEICPCCGSESTDYTIYFIGTSIPIRF